jgi:hypothetical protein
LAAIADDYREVRAQCPFRLEPILRMTIRTLAAACGAALLAHFVPFVVSSSAFAAEAPEHWVAVWATALQPIPQRAELPPLYRAPEVAGRTVRQIVYPSLSGKTARIHLSNAYGKTPLVVEELRIARSAGGAAAVESAGSRVTFGGKARSAFRPAGSWTAIRSRSMSSKARRMQSARLWGPSSESSRGTACRIR